jgi:hypothetical protein
MVPQPAPLHPAPARVHETAAFVVPVTAAENWLERPAFNWIVDGETLTATGEATVTTVVPEDEGSATETALITT